MTGAALIVGALSLGGWLYFARRAHALTEKDTIVLADFANTTGDAVFDDTLKQALAVDLGQSPFLNILSEETLPPDSDSGTREGNTTRVRRSWESTTSGSVRRRA
jgi:hypothetical protein